jgi:MFS transporter, DHA3 family, macrolide efflux protein
VPHPLLVVAKGGDFILIGNSRVRICEGTNSHLAHGADVGQPPRSPLILHPDLRLGYPDARWRLQRFSITVGRMRSILQHRPLRLVFVANAVSMVGSGMNIAAVTWYILQATHSEVALGALLVLQTLPALLIMPVSGVIIDREDRRRLLMLLDAARALVILMVALLALRHQAQLWQIYGMAMLVASGFWMFWPTIYALIQELTPETEYVASNTFLLAALQGGWLMAGAVVGWVYNHIGLGGVLLIDVSSYLVSFLCYLAIRKGRVVVRPPDEAARSELPLARFARELHEGISYLRSRPHLVMLGISDACFIGAMLSQGVVTAPLSDRILKSGAVGYGWLNAGWAVGAFLSAFYAPLAIGALGKRRSVVVPFSILALSLVLLPFSHWLAVAVALYMVMGSGRGVGGVAINSNIMESVQPQFMGRVQNTFMFFGTALQLGLGFLIGLAAHRLGLLWGFVMIASVYLLSGVATIWPVHAKAHPESVAAETTAD